MDRYTRIKKAELGRIAEWLNTNAEDEIVKISGIVIDPEWAYTQEWYKSMYTHLYELDPDDDCEYESLVMEPDKMLVPPKYLVRALEYSNTGYDILVDVVDGQYIMWGSEGTSITLVTGEIVTVEDTEFYGSAPAYQGCYGVDPEAKQWVKDLYNDAENVCL